MSNPYLAFTLGRDVFAFNAGIVSGVFQAVPVSPLPNASGYVSGSVNLRGRVIPVIDLRLRLGMEKAERTPKTCIIVLELPEDGATAAMGVLADSVVEVTELEPSKKQPATDKIAGVEVKYLRALGKRSELPVMIVDVRRLLSEKDREMLIA
jgi:purine-binding chemotaxis protein CheW